MNPWEEYAEVEAGSGPWDDYAEPAPVALTPSQKTGMSGTDIASGTASSLLQGATAEWGDELLAGPMALTAQVLGDAPKKETTIETYQRMKDSLRGRQKAFEGEYPVTSTVAKIAGGMVPLTKVAQGGSLVAAGVTGAGYGAAEYAGALDTFSDADLLDASLQIGLGAALPVGMQKTGEGVRQWLATRDPKEINAVLRKLVEQTQATPQQLRNRASDMGPEASLVDVTGDVGVAYGQGARATGGIPAVNAVERNLVKTDFAKDRIRDTMSAVSGKKDGQYFESLDALKANRKSNAERLYGDALDNGSVLPTTRMLYIFDNNPMVKDAWADVQRTYAKNGLPLPKLFSDVDGKMVNVDGERWPNMRAMQELKWSMDKQLRILKGSVDAKGKKEYSRAMDDYQDFMKDVNRQNPLFRKANAQYAGDSAMLEAQETGYKHGLGSKDVEIQEEYIKGLTKSEKDAYLQGVLANAYGGMGTSRSDLMGNANRLASENSNRVLNKLIGKDKAKKLMQQIKSERRYREVDTKLREGSQTELRKQAADVMKTEAGSIPMDIIKTPTMKIAEATVKKMLPKMTTAQVTEVADIITKAGGVDAALRRLTDAGVPVPVAEGLVGTLFKSGAMAATPQLLEENSLSTE